MDVIQRGICPEESPLSYAVTEMTGTAGKQKGIATPQRGSQ